MNVLVTGATGFIGSHVVARLQADGHRVRALVRDVGSSSAKTLATSGVELAPADFGDPQALGVALAGIDAVVHLIGIISETRRNTFEKAHVETTRSLLAAANRAGTRRWIQMSALGTRPDAVARYHQSKWRAEELVRGSGLDWTIFRPSMVLGPGSGFERTFRQIARWSPVVPVMGSGTNLMQPIQVHHVAKAFSRSLSVPATMGQTLDLCGERRMTMNTLLREVLAPTQRAQFHLPMGLARIQAGLMEAVLTGLLGRASPLTRDQLTMLSEDNVGNPEPARRLLDLD
jgi:uncharacterized protein YbjT (DUF2867 family)